MWKFLILILAFSLLVKAQYTFDLHGRQVAAVQDVIEISITAPDVNDLFTGKYLRYQLVMKFDDKKSRYYPINSARLQPVNGLTLETRFAMPKMETVKARKVAFCLQDTRPTRFEKLTGRNIKGCSIKIRLAPLRTNNEHDIIIGDQDTATKIEGNQMFPEIPSFVRSFVLYDLFFHLPSKLPYTAEQVQVYLKGDKSMYPLEIGSENQLILPSKDRFSPDTFFVQLRTPQLDSRSRNYKFCIRIKREYHDKLFSSNRGCSPPIPVAEVGSGGSTWLTYLEEQEQRSLEASRSSSVQELPTIPEEPEIQQEEMEIQSVDTAASDNGHIMLKGPIEFVQGQGEGDSSASSSAPISEPSIADSAIDFDEDEMRYPKFPSLMYPGYYLDRAKEREKAMKPKVATPPSKESNQHFIIRQAPLRAN